MWISSAVTSRGVPIDVSRPFTVATVFVGSIGLLGYVVWRGFTGRTQRD